jgi:poly-gamma-glutamate system protein
MKSIYWRPQKISRKLLVAIGMLALAGLTAVETFPMRGCPLDFDEKLRAAQLAQRAMGIIKEETHRRGYTIDRRFDPGETGLVGEAMTPLTSLPASLEAKQTSVNPNFAAVIVQMLKRAGVGPGDCVAVGYSGSFPALNVCLCAALETLQLRPIVIASTASSQFGANRPDLLWIDMERILFERGFISFRSTAASMGGFGDRARGMSDESRAQFKAAMERNNLLPIYPHSLSESIERRMQIYKDQSQGRPIKAYVNIGGGEASLRGAKGKKLFPAGLTMTAPAGAAGADSVISRFAVQGTPVINMVGAEELAAEFGFPVAPAAVPAVGTGKVFDESAPNRVLAGFVLLLIFAALRAFVLSDVGHRAITAVRRRCRPSTHDQPTWLEPSRGEPQLMV